MTGTTIFYQGSSQRCYSVWEETPGREPTASLILCIEELGAMKLTQLNHTDCLQHLPVLPHETSAHPRTLDWARRLFVSAWWIINFRVTAYTGFVKPWGESLLPDSGTKESGSYRNSQGFSQRKAICKVLSDNPRFWPPVCTRVGMTFTVFCLMRSTKPWASKDSIQTPDSTVGNASLAEQSLLLISHLSASITSTRSEGRALWGALDQEN